MKSAASAVAILALTCQSTMGANPGLRSRRSQVNNHFFSFAEIAEMKKGSLEPSLAVAGTNFDMPVVLPPKRVGCDDCGPMPYDDMLPIERKVVLAQNALDRLNKARQIEENALKIRLDRERSETDSAIKRKIKLQEKYEQEHEKIQELKNKIESAAYTAKRREQLLTDPNKFTDKCAPGFRVYWTGTSQTVMSWDDKKVLAKVLKDQYCNKQNMVCTCDLSKKQAHSTLGTVNAGLGCKCAEGIAEQVAPVVDASGAGDASGSEGVDASGSEGEGTVGASGASE